MDRCSLEGGITNPERSMFYPGGSDVGKNAENSGNFVW
jgi:hypothetical protein